MKKVAVIIVNYNGRKYLSSLLESIFKYLPETVKQEIIIIDNNSTDDSVEWLRNNYSDLKLIKMEKIQQIQKK